MVLGYPQTEPLIQVALFRYSLCFTYFSFLKNAQIYKLTLQRLKQLQGEKLLKLVGQRWVNKNKAQPPQGFMRKLSTRTKRVDEEEDVCL